MFMRSGHDPARPGASSIEDAVARALELDGDERASFVANLAGDLAERVRERLLLLSAVGLHADRHEDPAPLDSPDTIGGFQLDCRIGVGGMGEVWRARRDGEWAALKLIRPELMGFEGARARFQQETRALSSLHHEGIVAVIDFGEDAGVPFLALEWIEGASLERILDVLRTSARPPRRGEEFLAALGSLATPGATTELSYPHLVASLAIQVARALECAHRGGVIHRDVKPSNILVRPSGRSSLVDFGVARAREESRLTRSGAWLGSLPYASPEQLERAEATDERSDVYSLGATLYECLTLRTPFLGGPESRVRARILHGELEPPSHWNPDVDDWLDRVVGKALDLDPRRRYPSASELALDLERGLAGEPVLARRIPRWLALSRWAQRRPRTALAGIVALLVLGLVGFFAVREHRTNLRVRRMADREEIVRLVREAEDLRPPGPELLPRIATWLEDADRLLARGPSHEADLLAMRASGPTVAGGSETRDALLSLRLEVSGLLRFHTTRTDTDPRPGPGPPAERAALLAAWERELAREPAAFLAALTREVEAIREVLAARGGTGESYQLVRFDERIEELGRALLAPRPVRFDDSFQQWRLVSLTELVARLEDLTRVCERVRRLRACCEDLSRRSEEVQGAWERFAREVRGSSRYRGLRVTPLPFVLPLGEHEATGLWEFEVLGARPEAGGEGLVVVLLPGGRFEMGRDGGAATQAPRHEVDLAPFFVARCELTVGQARALGLACRGAVDEPACLDWETLRDALNRAGLELPTEAQWEYAARAGGEEPEDRARAANGMRAGVEARVRAVAELQPNAFGLFDVLGNADEWCLDWMVGRAYSTLPPRPGDGLRETQIESPGRVVRGGNFAQPLEELSVFRRQTANPASSPWTGARPVLNLR